LGGYLLPTPFKKTGVAQLYEKFSMSLNLTPASTDFPTGGQLSDYLYSLEELKKLKEKVKALGDRETYIFPFYGGEVKTAL
jgi:uncharacterized protein YecE (DUF72 family)